MGPASCHTSGAYNFNMTSTFLEGVYYFMMGTETISSYRWTLRRVLCKKKLCA